MPDNAEIPVKLTQLNWAKTSLKQYLYPENANVDYETITNLINNSDLWEEDNTKVDSNTDIPIREISLIDICQIQNDENRFSYMLAYFMQQKQYKELWKKFFKNAKCHSPEDFQRVCSLDITLKNNYSVTREKSALIEDAEDKKDNPNGGRIDIFICDKKNIVVIENKIKSDINSISTDENNSTQLRRYYNYVNWLIEKEKPFNVNRIPHFLILTPNYNIPEIEEERDKSQKLLELQMRDIYKIITYKELHDFLSENINVFKDDANFKFFYEAMKRHTYQNVNAYLYNEMEEKFIRRIKEINKQKPANNN